MKAGQFIGSNLKEKAVPSLGQQEGKAKAKAKEGAANKTGGGYVAPEQAATATKIDEKKAAARAAAARRRMPTPSSRRPPS